MDTDLKALGKRLRLAREQAGLSQEELAARLGRDQRAISEYELGKRRIAAVDLPRVAQILDTSLLYFFEDLFNPNDLDLVLLQQFHRLPTAKVQRAIIEMVRELSESLE